jgi:transcriptional regulator with XRE-family HTH domain
MSAPKQVRGIALPNLRAWRQSKGLSVRELGEMAGVQYSQISKIESAGQHVTPSTIRKLSEALGISREQLIGGLPAPIKTAPDTTESHADGVSTEPAKR